MERTLPHNLEAERALLGSMFMSNAAMQKACETLSKEVFYLNSNALIFQTIWELFQARKPIDTTTLTSELVKKKILNDIGGVEYLNDIVNSVATGANVEYYISTILEQYTLRSVIESSTDIVAKSFEAGADIASIIDLAEKNLANMSKVRQIGDLRKIQDVLTKTQEDIEKLSVHGGEVTGMPSGLYDLDKLTTGFQPNQLIIIAARPAVGKTALALNFAVSAAKSTKKSVVYFSLEMPAEQLASRMISSVGQINGSKLRNGNLESEDWRRLNEAISQLAETNIYFDDSGGITTGEIKAKCRRLAAEGEGIGLIVIDYLQLISGSSKFGGSNRQQEVSEISRNLKVMAMELQVPVIALSQLSRNVEKREDKKPVLSDLRESGSIEQDADIVMGIHAKEETENITDDAIPLPVEIIVMKHRNGPTKDIDVGFKKNTSTFISFKKEVSKA